MLNGWNRKVRISSAMIRAWMMTRTVSAIPPSLRFSSAALRFSSLDTLIGLLVSHLSRPQFHRADTSIALTRALAPAGSLCVHRYASAPKCCSSSEGDDAPIPGSWERRPIPSEATALPRNNPMFSRQQTVGPPHSDHPAPATKTYETSGILTLSNRSRDRAQSTLLCAFIHEAPLRPR